MLDLVQPKFFNLYALGSSDDRDELIAQFKAYFESDQELQEATSQQPPGRTLVCRCAKGQRCHADVLIAFREARAAGEAHGPLRSERPAWRGWLGDGRWLPSHRRFPSYGVLDSVRSRALASMAD